ncbi:MAG: hypothetical protein PHY29_03250 [Syntrophales bacterium]|nr:hypothetical protein [Syntrophales bacterium]
MTDAEWWEDYLKYREALSKAKTQDERDRLTREIFERNGENYDDYDPDDDTVMLAGVPSE